MNSLKKTNYLVLSKYINSCTVTLFINFLFFIHITGCEPNTTVNLLDRRIIGHTFLLNC